MSQPPKRTRRRRRRRRRRHWRMRIARTSTRRSTTGTVLLKARFANPDGTLWPGQFVQVALELYVDANAITVPTSAVQTGQQGTFVYTIDPAGNAKQRPVVVSRTVDSLTVLTSG